MQIRIDFKSDIARIRSINGGNLGPKLHGRKHSPATEKPFADLRLPLTLLHDAPLDNPGCRLVDIQHIFGNFKADSSNPDNYYFTQTDDYIRNILDCGTQIVYRLGTSIEHSIKNYYTFPPEDFEKWIDISLHIIRHYNQGWADGYNWNIKYWQIWNEADGHPNMWAGDEEEYFKLYEMSAKAIKKEFPDLKVGGPSSCKLAGWTERFTERFLEYCREHNAPLDFFGWHCYSNTPERLMREPAEARKLLDIYGFTETELFLTEWRYIPDMADTKCDEFDRRMAGIESGAVNTAVLTSWQDSPLDMGFFYTTTILYNSIFNRRSEIQPGLYYPFLYFAQMLDFRQRVSGECAEGYYCLAGHDNNGSGAALISVLNQNNSTINLELAGVADSTIKIYTADGTENTAVITNGKLTLTQTEPYTVYLLKELILK